MLDMSRVKTAIHKGGSNLKYTIDRIEGDFAICEDENRKMSEISIAEFPWKVKESTAFTKIENKFLIVDNQERHNKIKMKMDRLFKND